MVRLSFRPLVLIGALCGPVCRSTAQPVSGSYQATRNTLADFANRAELLGASGVVLVAERDTILLHRAMGWRDPLRRVPNDTSTLFYIASLAKQFVAAGVLRLEQDGRLRTTDSLPQFFSNVPPDKRRITVDQLLGHTSGLGRYGWDADRRDWAVQTRDEAVRGILETPLTGEPGARFSYQNTNYLLLAAIIERVSGVSLEDFIERQLLRPAGARDTYVGDRVTSALRSRVAWSVGDEAESYTIMDRAPTWLAHGRGVLTTAADLFRWVRAIERGVVLSDAARRKLYAMRTPFEPQYGYAAGWYVRTDSAGSPRTVFHRGDFRSYHSEARLSPVSGRISIVLMNTGFRGESMTEGVLNKAVAATRRISDSLPFVSGRPADAATLAGEYVRGKEDALLLEASNGSVRVTPVGQSSIDWLVLGDSAGGSSRRAAASATMSLIDQMKRGRIDAALPEAQRRDLTTEWAQLARAGGRLKSYQLLGTTRSSGNTDVSVVRLKFQRDSLLYAVGWKGQTLDYTIAGAPNPFAATVFAPTVADEWISVNWVSDELLRMTVGQSGGHPTVTLHTSRGPIVYTRR